MNDIILVNKKRKLVGPQLDLTLTTFLFPLATSFLSSPPASGKDPPPSIC
jgi:hypothetical protein